MLAAGASAKGFAKDLDQADSRMANLVQTGLALAPALVPIGAAAVPAIAGLTLQMGLAAGAAGVTLLAFNHVGDGLKALNAYQLEPTAKNFAKLNDALDKLGPAGQEFVLSLDKMMPKFEGLKHLAEQGLLPGVTDSLNELMDLMPQAREMVGTFSSTLGALVREGGDNLNDSRWVDFFDYIDRTAGPVLLDMGRTFGNLVEGFSNTLMAFDPLSRSFSSGFLDMSRSFNDWSKGLAQSQGFQDFVDYVQSNGPKALDALGSIAGALIQLVEAAAPVGSALLPAISALADGLAAIADSPVGPVLISAAAAIGVLGRSMALFKAVGITAGEDGKTGIIGRALGTENIKKSIPTMGQVGTVLAKAGQSAKYASEETMKARTAFSGFAKSIGPAAGLVGGMALATSGLGEKSGFANTMSLALMGTIAGPWGAAIGGGVGLAMDFAQSNDGLASSIKAADRAAKGFDLTAMSASYQDLATATDKAIEKQNTFGLEDFTPRATFDNYKAGLGGTTESDKGAAAAQKYAENIMELKGSLFQVRDAMGGIDWKKNADGTREASASTADYQETLDTTVQAFAAVGKSGDEALKFLTEGKGGAGWSSGVEDIKNYVAGLDSAEGKSASVAEALSKLGDEMQSNVTQADALKNAMASLFGTQMDQSAATDAWKQGLQSLRKEIAGTNGEINGNSAAALKNRDAIRGSVDDLQAKVSADAAAGVSGDKLVDSLIKGRKAIIDQGVAAGANRQKMSAYLNTLGLTPKNLTTIITADGALNAKQKMEALGKIYGLTPKQVRTLVSEAGANPSRLKVEALARALNKTPRDIRALLRAIDQASPTIAHVGGLLTGLNGRVATTFIRTVNQHVDQRLGATNRATGGIISGPGTGTSDSIPAYLSDGEYVIRAAAVDKYGTGMFDRLNAMHFADGGSVKTPKKPETPSETKARLEKEKNAREAARKAAEAKREQIKQSLYSFDLTGDMGVDSLKSAFHSLRDDFKLGDKAFRGLELRARKVTNSYERHTKALDADISKRDQLRSDKASLAGGITSAFTHDPFGNGIAGLQLQLQADGNDATAATANKNTLEKNGISKAFEEALFASGDTNTISQLAGLSKGDLQGFNSLYASTTAATTGLGSQVSATVFNASIQEQNTLIKQQQQTLKTLDKRMEGLEAAVERGARAGVHDRDKQTTQRRRAGR